MKKTIIAIFFLILFSSLVFGAGTKPDSADLIAYYECSNKTDSTGTYTTDSTSEPDYNPTNALYQDSCHFVKTSSEYLDTNIDLPTTEYTLHFSAYDADWTDGVTTQNPLGDRISATNRYGVLVKLLTSDLRFYSMDSDCTTVNTYSGGGSPTSGRHNYTIVNTGSNFLVYADSILVHNETSSGICNTGIDVFIGRNSDDAGDYQYWDGNIDEISFWDKALTGSNIQWLNDGNFYNEIVSAEAITYFEINAKSNKTLTTITNFTATLYSSNYTDTSTTTNGSVFFDIALNDYSLNITSNEYAIYNQNIGTKNNSDIFTAYLYENNSIWVNVYDGIGFYLLNGTTLNIIVDGENTSFYNLFETSNGTFYLNLLDADEYKFTFYNDDYPRQSYFVTLQDNEHKDLNAYILNNTFVSSVIVTVIDPYGTNVEGAVLTLQQNIGGTWTTISQETTDATGQSLFYLQIGTNYRVLITKTGYQTQTATITPTTDPYSVTLQLSQMVVYNYTYPFSCIDQFSFLPTQSEQENKSINFNLTVFSSVGTLSYYGLFLNSTMISNITASPTGGTTNINFNITTNNEYTVYYFFKCSGKSEYMTNLTYFASNLTQTNNTVIYVLSDSKDQISLIQKISIIIFSIIVGLLISYELNLPKKAYSFVVVFILIIFTIPQVSWIDIKITTLLSIIVLIPLFTSWRSEIGYG